MRNKDQIGVSIPYGYKQNTIKAIGIDGFQYVSIPYRYKTKLSRTQTTSLKETCLNPLQVQTKQEVSYEKERCKTRFQSPIGTNKTPYTVKVTVDSVQFQSPIGTNKTNGDIIVVISIEEFQSPIGTNKTHHWSSFSYG